MKTRNSRNTVAGMVMLIGLMAMPIRAAVVQDWQFNDPPGTGLPDTANSAAPVAGTANGQAQWDVNLDDSFTTGDGVYRIQRGTGGPIQAIASPFDVVNSGTTFLRAEIAGWQLQGLENESVRIGFVTSSSGDFITARMRLERTASDAVTLFGDAFGDGSSDIAGSVSFSNIRLDPLFLVLKVDKDNNQYEVFWSDTGQSFQSIGVGDVRPQRNANAILLGAVGNFDTSIGDEDDFFDISRIFQASNLGSVMAIPEPGTTASIMLGLLLIAGRRWRMVKRFMR